MQALFREYGSSLSIGLPDASFRFIISPLATSACRIPAFRIVVSAHRRVALNAVAVSLGIARHDIPEEKIRERYPRAIANLIALMPG